MIEIVETATDVYLYLELNMSLRKKFENDEYMSSMMYKIVLQDSGFAIDYVHLLSKDTVYDPSSVYFN